MPRLRGESRPTNATMGRQGCVFSSFVDSTSQFVDMGPAGRHSGRFHLVGDLVPENDRTAKCRTKWIHSAALCYLNAALISGCGAYPENNRLGFPRIAPA